MKKGLFGTLAGICVSLLFLLPSQALRATLVMELSLEELVAGSALIFTGEVLDVVVSTEDELVYSTVTFAIDDLVKGDFPAQVLTLRFLGGASAALQVEVAGQYIPATGDRGLYFVNNPQQEQVNPLTGWSQGYFPLLEAEGGEAYLDLRNHPDYGLVSGVPDPLADKMRALHFSREQVANKFPDSLEFPLLDFVEAIQAAMAVSE